MAVNKRKILEAAQKFLQKGALDKALREYRTLLDLDPRDSGARLKLGDIHLRLGEKDDAVAAYLKVAHQFMKDGFDAKAVALFKQIAKLAPEQIEVHVPLSELYQRLGLTPEAMSALQTAVEAFQKAGRKREALELLRKAAALDPTNTTSRLKIADLLRAQGMDEEALNEYEEVAAELERNGETGGLASVYERMLELEPERLSALIALSRLSLRESAPERALELAERAASLRPDLMDAVQLHAESLQAVGRPTEEQEPVWRRLAELHLARGDEADGRAILQRFCSSYDLTQNGVDLGNGPAEGLALAPETELPGPGEITQAGRQLGALLPPADDLLLDPPLASPPPAVPQAPEGAPPDADIEQLLAEAGVYLRFGKRERAMASLEAVLVREPGHPGALEKLAGAVAQEGDLARATTLLAEGAAQREARGDAAGAAQLRSRMAEIDPGCGAGFGEGRAGEAVGPELPLEAPGQGAEPGLGADGSGLPIEALPEAPSDTPSGAEEESPFELEVELDFSDPEQSLPELGGERPTSEAAEPIHLPLEEGGPDGFLSAADSPEELSAEGIEVGLRDGTQEVLPAYSGEVLLEESPGLGAELPAFEPEAEPGSAGAGDPGASHGAPAVAAEGEPRLEDEGEAFPAREGEPFAGSEGETFVAHESHRPVVQEGDPSASSGAESGDFQDEVLLDSEVTLDEEVAPPAVAAPAAWGASGSASLSSSPKQILEDLEEGDFYFQQQLLDEAEVVYRRVLEAAPTNPQALLRLGEIAAARGDDPASARGETSDEAVLAEATPPSDAVTAAVEPTFGDDLAEWDDATMAVTEAPVAAPVAEDLADESAAEDLPAPEDAGDDADGSEGPAGEEAREISHFDLAAELSEDLAVAADPGASLPSLSPDTEPSLEAIFSEFKRGVQRTLTAADHETHYDLGIAYREMGLYEDAMSEFRIALESPERRLDCLHLLGLCARDLKRPLDAVAFLRQALADEGLAGERRFSTLYDLSYALEEAGQAAEALESLERLREEAPDHPALAERIESLRALQTLSPTEPSVEAVPETGEVFESFDDLIADAEAAFVAESAPETSRNPQSERPEPPPDRPSPAPPRGKPPRKRKISFG